LPESSSFSDSCIHFFIDTENDKKYAVGKRISGEISTVKKNFVSRNRRPWAGEWFPKPLVGFFMEDTHDGRKC